MKRCLQIVCFIGAVCATFDAAKADESFLDRQFTTTWVCYQSPQELLQVLRSVVPKPLLLPEGMSLPEGMPPKKPLVNPTEAEKARAGAGGLFGRVPGDKTPFTMRDYLDRAVRSLGMNWHYEAAKDSVVLDFPWHVSSALSNTELMKTLSDTTPPEDEKHVYSSTIDLKNDAWRPAFNALLSKPGNYPKAWQVRWKMEGGGWGFGGRQPTDFFTGEIIDGTGTAHFLILNVQPFTAGAVSTISYYLFSGTGVMENGGLFYAEDGHGGQLRVELASSRRRLLIHNGIDPAYNRYDQIFAVEKNRLVFKEGKPYGNLNVDHPPCKFLFEVAGG